MQELVWALANCTTVTVPAGSIITICNTTLTIPIGATLRLFEKLQVRSNTTLNIYGTIEWRGPANVGSDVLQLSGSSAIVIDGGNTGHITSDEIACPPLEGCGAPPAGCVEEFIADAIQMTGCSNVIIRNLAFSHLTRILHAETTSNDVTLLNLTGSNLTQYGIIFGSPEMTDKGQILRIIDCEVECVKEFSRVPAVGSRYRD